MLLAPQSIETAGCAGASLQLHMMSSPPPLSQTNAREQPVPQVTRLVNEGTGRQPVEFLCPPMPNVQIDMACQRRGNEMAYRVPEPRRLAAANTIGRYVGVIHARMTLHRLRKAAQERAKAEARAVAAQEWRAAQEAAQLKWSQEYAAKVAEQRRNFEEHVAKNKAEHGAREAMRISKAREARAEQAHKKAEAEAANKEKERLAKLAAKEQAQIDRVARGALKAEAKAKKKVSRDRPCPFKAEEERQRKQNEEERYRKKEVEKQETKKQEDEHKATEEDKEAKRAARLAKKTLSPPGPMAKGTAPEPSPPTRETLDRVPWTASPDQFAYNELMTSLKTMKQEADVVRREGKLDKAQEIYEAVLDKMEGRTFSLDALDTAQSKEFSMLRAQCGGSLSGVKAGHVQFGRRTQGWADAAKNAHKMMREVTEAAAALREAEDTARAIKESLESYSTPPPPAPVPKDPASGLQKRRGRRVCWYFERGKCRNGDACAYLHTTPEKSAPGQSTSGPAPVATAEKSARGQSTPEPAPAAKTKKSVPASEPTPVAAPESNPYCVICFEGIKDQLCMPCKHLCICSDCTNIVPPIKSCPMCRETVTEIIKVFT